MRDKPSVLLTITLSSKSIDAVVSSPPYCTRIDYVRATLPELAVIAYPNGHSLRRLRESMIGTPTIDNICKDNNPRTWGNTCKCFLSEVARHSSKASATYYLKYYQQYFGSAFISLREIDRVLKKRGWCVLVIRFAKETLCAQICINSFTRAKVREFARTRYEDLLAFFEEYERPQGKDLQFFKDKRNQSRPFWISCGRALGMPQSDCEIDPMSSLYICFLKNYALAPVVYR